jgi:RimJ/RimL family protein N-acetyltransferase
MIRFERTHDLALIRRVMTDPSVYARISDDGCPDAPQFEAADNPALWYVAVHDGSDELLGLFLFVPQNAVCWEVHTALLPLAYGPRAARAGSGVISWVWANTPCRRLMTNVPAYNRLALRYAERAGLTQFGLNPGSYLKNGVLFDQILLGVSRPEGDSDQLTALSHQLMQAER